MDMDTMNDETPAPYLSDNTRCAVHIEIDSNSPSISSNPCKSMNENVRLHFHIL